MIFATASAAEKDAALSFDVETTGKNQSFIHLLQRHV